MVDIEKSSVASHDNLHDEYKSGYSLQGIPPPELEYPDGGFLAWSQVFCAFLLTFYSGGILNAFGAFQTYYETGLLKDHSPSAISWIGSIQGFLLLVVGVLAGPIFDMGYFRSLAYIGSLMVIVGVMLTSMSTEYYQVFLAQGILVGVGAGFFYIPSIALVSSYFKKRRSFAVCTAACGSSIGGAVFPAVFHELQPRIGFGWTTRVIGFISIIVFLIAALIMRPRPATQTHRQLLDPAAWKSLPYALFTFAVFLGYLGLYIPYFYISAYAQIKAGTGAGLAFYIISIMNGVSILGRTGPSWLADKFGPLNTLVVCSLICSALAFAWTAIDGLVGLLVFAVLYGIFQGTLVSLPAATIPSLSPDHTRVGAHIGMSMSCAGLGLLLGSPIAGTLLDLEKANFLHAQVFCGVIVLISGLGYASARVAKVGFSLTAIA